MILSRFLRKLFSDSMYEQADRFTEELQRSFPNLPEACIKLSTHLFDTKVGLEHVDDVIGFIEDRFKWPWQKRRKADILRSYCYNSRTHAQIEYLCYTLRAIIDGSAELFSRIEENRINVVT